MARFIDRFKNAFSRGEKEEKKEGGLPIGEKEIKKAVATLESYKSGKAVLENRIVGNERWWKMRHGEMIKGVAPSVNRKELTASGWTFNSITQKHADAMDSYPTCNVLPREESDKATAELLSDVLPVIIDHTNFRKTYWDGWWSKLKNGTAVYKPYWDPDADGIGDIAIEYVDLLNLFWQPGIKDIQKSRNVFHVETWDDDALREVYDLPDDFSGEKTISVKQYIHDESEGADKGKSVVVDWWYKKRIDNRAVVHYCRFVGDRILYASENDPEYAGKGYYDHGKYPFVFDVLFPEVDMPTGFGYIDILKGIQSRIDVTADLFAQKAVLAAKPRFFLNKTSGINPADFEDGEKTVIEVEGSLSSIRDMVQELKVEDPPAILLNYLESLVNELKEVSGCRDINQGGTTSGVTAASAIAALQEAGSKTSRDATMMSYRAFEQICEFVIELIRQFYKTARSFRITKENKMAFEDISGDMLDEKKTSVTDGDLYTRRAVFDVSISAQKGSPFSRISQNELIKELYQLGVFRPDLADQALVMLDAMEFEGKDEMIEKIRQNAVLQKQVAALSELLQSTANALGGGGIEMPQQAAPPQTSGGGVETDTLGGAVMRGSAVVDRAREQAQNAASPAM
ncbi:MAG: hypothetical protein J5756_04140 [Clostridia bacterium]|nr:hypothetical protein [Clostridia bacterium]